MGLLTVARPIVLACRGWKFDSEFQPAPELPDGRLPGNREPQWFLGVENKIDLPKRDGWVSCLGCADVEASAGEPDPLAL